MLLILITTSNKLIYRHFLQPEKRHRDQINSPSSDDNNGNTVSGNDNDNDKDNAPHFSDTNNTTNTTCSKNISSDKDDSESDSNNMSHQTQQFKLTNKKKKVNNTSTYDGINRCDRNGISNNNRRSSSHIHATKCPHGPSTESKKKPRTALPIEFSPLNEEKCEGGEEYCSDVQYSGNSKELFVEHMGKRDRKSNEVAVTNKSSSSSSSLSHNDIISHSNMGTYNSDISSNNDNFEIFSQAYVYDTLTTFTDFPQLAIDCTDGKSKVSLAEENRDLFIEEDKLEAVIKAESVRMEDARVQMEAARVQMEAHMRNCLYIRRGRRRC